MSTEALNRRVFKLASYRRFSFSGDVRDMSEAQLIWTIAKEMPDSRAWLDRFRAMSGAEQNAELERLIAEAPRDPGPTPNSRFPEPDLSMIANWGEHNVGIGRIA
jgi:hypothetical protein